MPHLPCLSALLPLRLGRRRIIRFWRKLDVDPDRNIYRNDAVRYLGHGTKGEAIDMQTARAPLRNGPP